METTLAAKKSRCASDREPSERNVSLLDEVTGEEIPSQKLPSPT